jgi:serine/threonine-protein kinase RsbW
MSSKTPPFSLALPSDLRMVHVVRAFIEAVCQAYSFDSTTTHAVVLATSEAASNVVRHAHREQPDAQLQIQCSFEDDSIVINIQDEGAPFDLASVPRLDPSEIRVGGRGVFLMRALMDELSCQPRPERGNTLRMVKHFGRSFLTRNCG